ncbi:hypothetical protein U1Q18_010120, partial [Sarracenia purpurea var. burkii]
IGSSGLGWILLCCFDLVESVAFACYWFLAADLVAVFFGSNLVLVGVRGIDLMSNVDLLVLGSFCCFVQVLSSVEAFSRLL